MSKPIHPIHCVILIFETGKEDFEIEIEIDNATREISVYDADADENNPIVAVIKTKGVAVVKVAEQIEQAISDYGRRFGHILSVRPTIILELHVEALIRSVDAYAMPSARSFFPQKPRLGF